MRVRFTPGAQRQIAAIHAYIARESRSGADNVVSRIEAVADMLAQHPYIGRKLPVSRLYRFPVRPYPYLIYYHLGKRSEDSARAALSPLPRRVS